MASSIFILDQFGHHLISRDYRGDVPVQARSIFISKLINSEDHQIKPVMFDDETETTFIHKRHNDLICNKTLLNSHISFLVLAVTRKNLNAAMIVVFLNHLVRIFNEYFSEFNEESVRTNFEVIYELLDEVVDNGIPQVTDASILKNYIKQKGTKLISSKKTKAPKNKREAEIQAFQNQMVLRTVTGATPWRNPNTKYKVNELWVDVVEKAHLLVSSSGTTLRSEIEGAIILKSQLSGMPEILMAINDRLVFKTSNDSISTQKYSNGGVEVEDVVFHKSVSIPRFESNRVLCLVPPDGEFQCLKYRLTTTTKLRPLFWTTIQISKHGRTRISYLINCKSQFRAGSVAQNVVVTIPVRSDSSNLKYPSTTGSVSFSPELNSILWKFKKFPGQHEYVLKATVNISSTLVPSTKQNKRPITMKFEIPYFTMTGLRVTNLKVNERGDYQSFHRVRYVTLSGNYEFRMPSDESM